MRLFPTLAIVFFLFAFAIPDKANAEELCTAPFRILGSAEGSPDSLSLVSVSGIARQSAYAQVALKLERFGDYHHFSTVTLTPIVEPLPDGNIRVTYVVYLFITHDCSKFRLLPFIQPPNNNNPAKDFFDRY